MISHLCIHCGQLMEGIESPSSDFMDLIKYECTCILRKTTHGVIYGYTKWVDASGFLQRSSIVFERYSIITDYATSGHQAFSPYRGPQTELICNAPNIYDFENGLPPYISTNPPIRRLSGESWHKKLSPKDFTGMTIIDIKRWIKMIENFQ